MRLCKLCTFRRPAIARKTRHAVAGYRRDPPLQINPAHDVSLHIDEVKIALCIKTDFIGLHTLCVGRKAAVS